MHNVKKGHGNFCNRSCAALFRNKFPPIREGKHVELKEWAQKEVQKALKDGRLVKLDYCEYCKVKEKKEVILGTRIVIECHHDDYSKPLEVQQFCMSCHKKWHFNTIYPTI